MQSYLERLIEWVNLNDEKMVLIWDNDYEESYVLNRKQMKIIRVPEYEDIFRYVTDIKEITYVNSNIQYAIDESIGNESVGKEFIDAYNKYEEEW